ncbi:13388_t:CDS:2 [Funneliformis geosporum]|uniref:13388_t:CDS:1 n=1 Tax=Funneliformis geosporum TaxID=1117311 RepID=A0A9W4SDC7_9GLOM|nr:13388_t:CDS:2 [Funneliformis geosporum]
MELFETFKRNYEDSVESPVYGYLLHNDEQRLEILEKYPEISARELSITIANKWRSLSEEKKNEYSEKAKELNWERLSEFMINKCEKGVQLEHVNDLVVKLKEMRYPSKKSRHLLSFKESEESDEDVSDYNIYTQGSYQYDSNTNSSSTLSVDSLEQPSNAFAHYVIDGTPSLLRVYPNMNLEGVKQVLLDNWNNMSPELRAPWVKMAEQSYEGYERLVSNIDSNDSTDNDFDDLFNNTEEGSEIGESNQSYIQELIHTYNYHNKSQHLETVQVPTDSHSESWIQPFKMYENNVENGELVTISPLYTTRQSEVVTKKDLPDFEEVVSEHRDTQLDVQSSYQKNISAHTRILSFTQENIQNGQTIASKPSKKCDKPLEIQFLVEPYDKENDHAYVASPDECKRDTFYLSSTKPFHPRNMNCSNEENDHKPRNVQQFQQDKRYSLQVPVPYIGACDHYQRATNFDSKYKNGLQARQTEFNKSFNIKWKQLVFSEKKMWEDMAKADKERYEKEREEYQTSQYERFLKSQEGIPLYDWFKADILF